MSTAQMAAPDRRPLSRARFGLDGVGPLALITGLWAALLMLDLHVPAPRRGFAEIHGPLMVIVGLPLQIGPVLLVLGGLGLVGLYVVAARRQSAFHLGVMATLFALAGWLAVYDVARRTVRQPGLTRYMAVCLLAGYGWLAVAGGLWLRFGTLDDGAAYDAMLHALFLGFVIGMVFAHAPVIAPAVFRIALPYRRHFYAYVVLLHASLALRLVGGDLAGNHTAWQVGGVLNEVALLCFLAMTVHAVRTGHRSRSTVPVRATQHVALASAAAVKGAQP